jgi:hypothetical protein
VKNISFVTDFSNHRNGSKSKVTFPPRFKNCHGKKTITKTRPKKDLQTKRETAKLLFCVCGSAEAAIEKEGERN